ncbi:MAG: TlpA family protein disulfide reductase [Ginsengibacter sp.]
MKFLLIITLSLLCLTLPAQKAHYAKLKLIYPIQLTYDTLLVKGPKGEILSEISSITKEGKRVCTYLINPDPKKQGSFSIYFGGSLSAVNDTLYFLSHGNDLLIELQDSFSLRNYIRFKLKNVYNFEQLYDQYNRYYTSKMQEYDSLVKINPAYPLSSQQYSLNAGFDFVKKHLENPYSIDLFAVFIINPPFFHVEYNQANKFYVKNLKNNINNTNTKIFVEGKLEKLKESLKEGTRAPYFSGRSIQGKLINSSSLSGKNVLLIFWATWCGPCMKELPYLKLINEEFKKNNLVMVSVSLDRDSTKMVKVINENKLNWIQLFNVSSMTDPFRINPIPAIFLIDEKGVILYNKFNRENETDNLELLRALLKQKFQH